MTKIIAYVPCKDGSYGCEKVLIEKPIDPDDLIATIKGLLK